MTISALGLDAGTAPAAAGMMRFGTFALAIDADNPFWAMVLPRRFRAAPQPHPGVDTDMVLRIRHRPALRPAVLAGDVLSIERTVDRARVGCDMMTLEVDFAARPAVAELAVHVGDAAEPEIEHCFAVFVHKLLQLSGVVRLHAAAVEIASRSGAAFTHVFLGDKGAGKSTLALALGRAGGRVLADDQLVLRRRGGGIAVSGCDGNIRLTAEAERHFLTRPLAVAAQDYAGTWKKEVRLDSLASAIPHSDRTARRLYFPRVGRRLAIAPVGRRAALLRVLDSIALAHGFAGAADRMELVQMVTDFVMPIDCFDLELSPDLDELDRVIESLRE